MTTITFVTPWYGPEAPGGAEAETRRTAWRLQQAGLPVEVMTTCTRDLYADWGRNYYPHGVTDVDGIRVRRFAVQQRNRQAFDQVNWRLMNDLPVTADQEQTYINEMLRAPALYEAMAEEAAGRLYILIPYMFATTYYGAQVCPERSLVIPCLHDESYARLSLYREVLLRVRGLVFHTQAEEALARRLYGLACNGQIRTVLGEGVDSEFTADAGRFRQRYGIHGPFVLYAGRREPGKNAPLLLKYWERLVRETQREIRLVLIGAGDVAIPPDLAGHVLDLGFVPVQDKYDAYAAADVFCLPSLNESFSIVLMESWLAGTPSLVHGRCAVTLEHTLRGNGGLYFTDYDEFVAALNYLLEHPDVADRLGQQGRRYVLRHYAWDVIVPRYEQLIQEVLKR
jgi:glycosyltransferase involved in cell wall biosynthesis